ncbi:MAG: type IV secretion system DNA-binding domain-containing protein [Patescibacteria group bacterium]|nr:type IV secretion system DNA-binding domain-containing protein [Patescibacteria group bacterium]
MNNPDKITYFAETDSRHNHKKFGIKTEDRSKHVYVIGKTGMGKSTLLENLAIQDIQNGNGIVFIDPHGGTAEKLLEYVPEERIKDVLYLAPFDMEHPVSFNIMEDVGANKRHLVVNGLMSVFEKIWEDAWSARMAYILQNTLLALLEYPGATLLAVNRMYTDKEFRNKVVANVTDVSVKSFWIDEYARYTDKYTQEATPAIQNKIGQFAGNPLIRNIIGQSKSSFNLREIMDEKKIMIVNLSKGRVGEGNARLLGSMLITKLYLAAMSRSDEKASVLAKLPQFYLFVDEFQSFADRSFADILSEARKYKLNLTMAHQYIEQMDEEVRDAVFGNVGTMIVFRVGAYDADVLEKEFTPTFTAEDLVNLGLRQIYLKLMIDSVTSQPFSATTMPPIEPPEVSYVDKIIEYSRKTFAKPRSEVEKRIIDWHQEGRVIARAPSPKVMVSSPVVRPVVQPLIKPLEKKPIPTHTISLEHLKDKDNNQRKPDVKHISDLRDALRAVVGNRPTINPSTSLGASNPQPTTDSKLEPRSKQLEAKREPSPEELKKILDVS